MLKTLTCHRSRFTPGKQCSDKTGSDWVRLSTLCVSDGAGLLSVCGMISVVCGVSSSPSELKSASLIPGGRSPLYMLNCEWRPNFIYIYIYAFCRLLLFKNTRFYTPYIKYFNRVFYKTQFYQASKSFLRPPVFVVVDSFALL